MRRRDRATADWAEAMTSPKPGAWDSALTLKDPALQRLHELWQAKCRSDALPARGDFDPLEMKDWLGSMFLVEAIPEDNDFRYTLIGTKITQHVGVDNTGKRISEVFGPAGLDLYRTVRDECRPIRVHGTVDWRRQEYKAYETLILPLADDGQRVNRFIGAMVFQLPRA
jgi:hypothetical protein